MREHVKNALVDARRAVDRVVENDETLESIVRSGGLIASALEQGNKVISCGNGGSMCDAMHFAEELAGRFRKDRRALPAMAISDPGYLSCAANDFGYEQTFARYVEAHGKKGDVLLAISTSGKSPNVIQAAQRAKELGLAVVGLTGRESSPLAEYCDQEVCASGADVTDRVQEVHIKVIHIFIELCERQLFPANYS